MKTKEMCSCFRLFIPFVQWMATEDGIRLMPHIIDGENRWRINYCPSCGKEVRSIELTEDEMSNYLRTQRINDNNQASIQQRNRVGTVDGSQL